jgi:hypothetical protein
MKKPQTVCITMRRPQDAGDPGECAIVHYTVVNGVVSVTDADGHLLRYSADGEPCRQALGPDDNPRQIAARLGHRYHTQHGDRERGFWRDMPRTKDVRV